MDISGAAGRFIAGSSFVHSLDPRCKILCTAILLVGLFVVSSLADLLFWALLPIALAISSGLTVRRVIAPGRSVIWLILITSLVNMIWTPGEVIARAGPIAVTREGIVLAIRMSVRLYMLVVIAAVLMMTTSPKAFSDGMERILKPLSIIGVPSAEIAMMMTIALRFIPTLFEEADRIVKAQMSRGADHMSGGLIARAKKFIPILVPLFVIVFRRADDLALAMEARCYMPGAKRTKLRQLTWSGRDTLAVAASICWIASVACGAWAVRAFFGI